MLGSGSKITEKQTDQTPTAADERCTQMNLVHVVKILKNILYDTSSTPQKDLTIIETPQEMYTFKADAQND